ncbi:elongation factor P maturation arginine rhamnosyltransferase EarP [Escherichia coli]
MRAFNHALNLGEDTSKLWAQWPRYSAIWQQDARSWSQKLLEDGDLVTRLVKFLESRI